MTACADGEAPWPEASEDSSIFAEGVLVYLDQGWRGLLPLPPGQKSPPPEGYTGKDAPDPTIAQLSRWFEIRTRANLALRLPRDVMGLDVDEYGHKNGACRLADLEAVYGALPATWRSSARPWPSGIRFYRIPPDAVITRGEADLFIEIIRHSHRYAAVWPSVHPDVGSQYAWYTPSQEPAAGPPRPDDLPALPEPWLRFLTGAEPNSVVDDDEPIVMRDFSDVPRTNGQARTFKRRPDSNYGRAALERELGRLWLAENGTRNNQLNSSAHSLFQLVAGGQLDAEVVIDQLREMGRVIKLESHEVERTIESALRSGIAKPRTGPSNNRHDRRS